VASSPTIFFRRLVTAVMAVSPILAPLIIYTPTLQPYRSLTPTLPLPYLDICPFPCLMTPAVRHFRFRTLRLFQDMSNA
jgi:hypothetical protein